MEECTLACLVRKCDRTQVIIQWSQMLEMVAPLMLCAAQRTSLLPRKRLQETPPPMLRKWWNFSHKLLGQNLQKLRNDLARFGLPKIDPQRHYSIPSDSTLSAAKIRLKTPPLVPRKLWNFIFGILVKNPERILVGLDFWNSTPLEPNLIATAKLGLLETSYKSSWKCPQSVELTLAIQSLTSRVSSWPKTPAPKLHKKLLSGLCAVPWPNNSNC